MEGRSARRGRRRPACLESSCSSNFPAGDSHADVSATAADGLRLPVVDAAHPALAVPDAIPRASRRGAMGFLAWDRRNGGMLGGTGPCGRALAPLHSVPAAIVVTIRMSWGSLPATSAPARARNAYGRALAPRTQRLRTFPTSRGWAAPTGRNSSCIALRRVKSHIFRQAAET
jgi:hypothetical protein